MALTSLRWAGAAAAVSGTWANAANAAGKPSATYATWSSTTSGASAAFECSDFGVQAVLPDPAVTMEAVRVRVRYATSSTTLINTLSMRLYAGTTALASSVTMTKTANSVAETVYTVTGVTYAQLSDLRVRVTASRASTTSTTNSIVYIDRIGVEVDYTWSPWPSAALGEYSVFGDPPTLAAPPTTTSASATSYVMGTQFEVAGARKVLTGVRIWRPADAGLTSDAIVAGLFLVATGAEVARIEFGTITGDPAGAWVTRTFDPPVVLLPGEQYIVCALYPSGYPITNPHTWTDRVDGPVRAGAGPNAHFVTSTTLTYPSATVGTEQAYWVDPVVGDPPAANGCPNPSLETDTTGYVVVYTRSGITTGAVGRSSVIATAAGAGVMYGFVNATGDGSTSSGSDFDVALPRCDGVTGGQPYTFSCFARHGVTGAELRWYLRWEDDLGANLGVITSSPQVLSSTSWERHRLTETAPAGATRAVVQLWIYKITSTGTWPLRFDGVAYEQTTGPGVYGDGDTAGWVWDGAAHASTSREVTGTAVPFGRAGATSSARPLGSSKLRAAGRAGTTGTARPLAGAKAYLLGRAGDLAAARPVVETRTTTLGRAGTTSGVRPPTAAKITPFGRVGTADAARPAAATRTYPLGRAGDLSGAREVRSDKGLRRVGDLSQARALTAAKTTTLGRAGDVAAPRTPSTAKTTTLGALADGAAARPVAAAGKTALFGRAGTTTGARPVEFRRLHPLGRTGDTASARPVEFGRAYPIDPASDTSGARPLSAEKRYRLGWLATSQGHARPLTPRKTRMLGRASDRSRARELAFTTPGPGGLTVFLWALDRTTGALIALPHHTQLTLSLIANSPGSVSVEYPAYGRNADTLRDNVTGRRDCEVEIWLGGSRATAVRAILYQAAGDDVAPDAVWSFSGHFLEQRMAEALIEPQPADEKRELRFATAVNAGQIMGLLLDQAQARGALTDIGRDFTSSVDSAGTVWPVEVAGLKFSPKTTYLQVLGKLVELGMCEWTVTAAHVLRVWAAEGRGVDRTTGARPVQFRRGRNVTESPRRRSSRDAGTAILVDGAEGLYTQLSDASALAERGRRVEVAGSANNIENSAALTAFGQRYLAAAVAGEHEQTHGLAFGPGHPVPVRGFDVGDRCWSETTGTVEAERVAQWTLTVDVGGPAGTVSLGSLLVDRLVAMYRRLNEISSGGAVVGTSEATPVDDVDAPQVPDVATFVIDSFAYQDTDLVGAPSYATVTLGWGAVAATDVAGYRVRYSYPLVNYVGDLGSGAYAGGPTWFETTPADGTDTTWSWGGVEAGATIHVQVRAFDRAGNQSAWSQSLAHVTATDNTPPPAPSTPTLGAWFRTLDTGWDGRDSSGAVMLAAAPDLDRVQVWLSRAANPTVDPTVAAGPFDPAQTGPQHVADLYTAGVWNTPDIPHGIGYHACLVAVDRAGNASPRSAVAGPVTPEQLVSQDLLDSIISAPKIADFAVGSAKIVDAAVVRAKIGDLAVNDAKVDTLSAGKITTGTLVATVTLTGIIRTASTGLRWEGDPAGIRFYNSAGTLTIRLESATGNTLITGTMQSALTGERWVMMPDGTLRLYPPAGTNYSQIANFGSEVVWRGPIDGNQRSGRVNASSVGVGLNFSKESEIPDNLRAEVAAFDLFVKIVARSVALRADGRYGGDPHIRFAHTASNSLQEVGGSVLEYRYDGTEAGGEGPRLRAPGINSGLKFRPEVLLVQDGFGSYRAINASAFNVSSARHLKRDVRDLPIDAVQLRARVAAVVPKLYRRADEVAGRPPRPPMRLPRPRLDDQGRPVRDADGHPIVDQVDGEWAYEPLPAKERVGLIAEDLAAQFPEVVSADPADPESLVVDVMGVTALLWQQTRDHEARLAALEHPGPARLGR